MFLGCPGHSPGTNPALRKAAHQGRANCSSGSGYKNCHDWASCFEKKGGKNLFRALILASQTALGLLRLVPDGVDEAAHPIDGHFADIAVFQPQRWIAKDADTRWSPGSDYVAHL